MPVQYYSSRPCVRASHAEDLPPSDVRERPGAVEAPVSSASSRGEAASSEEEKLVSGAKLAWWVGLLPSRSSDLQNESGIPEIPSSKGWTVLKAQLYAPDTDVELPSWPVAAHTLSLAGTAMDEKQVCMPSCGCISVFSCLQGLMHLQMLDENSNFDPKLPVMHQMWSRDKSLAPIGHQAQSEISESKADSSFLEMLPRQSA